MKTIALRFSDNYAPTEGMIYHHQKIIDEYGFCWYGKFGSSISRKIIEEQLKLENPKILLIKSGSSERYWIHFSEYKDKEVPEAKYIPLYYRNQINKIKSWIKVTKFEKADKNVMSKCFVISTGDCLSNASKHCMNPYFKIEYRGE